MLATLRASVEKKRLYTASYSGRLLDLAAMARAQFSRAGLGAQDCACYHMI